MFQPTVRRATQLALSAAAALTAFAFFTAPDAQADVRKIMEICEGGLCPVFLPELPVPAGWRVDEDASKANGIVVLVPDGSRFGNADAVIYARAFHNAGKRTIESRVEESNRRWLGAVKDARIERLADIAAKPNAVPFQLYRYSNPSTAQQSAEIVAFGEDTDKEGNPYGVQMVISAMSEAQLDRHKAVFLDLLKAY